MKCEVEGCNNEAASGRWDMCMKHYKRWYKHGDPNVVLQATKFSKERWVNTKTGYVQVKQNGILTYEHIVLAEKALGKPLPKGAIVHHMNQDRTDNYTPFNLVICPNQDYHLLLHRRMKAYDYANNPNR